MSIGNNKMNFKYSILNNHILALSIGVIYVWFGALKYFPNLSPAEDLAENTIHILTNNLIPSRISIKVLAIGEFLLGLLLILNIYRRVVVIMALLHMILTFVPLFLFPEQVFNSAPFHLTLLGQYIFKNIIIIGGLLTLYRLSNTEVGA